MLLLGSLGSSKTSKFHDFSFPFLPLLTHHSSDYKANSFVRESKLSQLFSQSLARLVFSQSYNKVW